MQFLKCNPFFFAAAAIELYNVDTATSNHIHFESSASLDHPVLLHCELEVSSRSEKIKWKQFMIIFICRAYTLHYSFRIRVLAIIQIHTLCIEKNSHHNFISHSIPDITFKYQLGICKLCTKWWSSYSIHFKCLPYFYWRLYGNSDLRCKRKKEEEVKGGSEFGLSSAEFHAKLYWMGACLCCWIFRYWGPDNAAAAYVYQHQHSERIGLKPFCSL